MSVSYEREQKNTPAFTAADALFNSLHRVLICLDAEFRIVHASGSVGELLSEGQATPLIGQPVQNLFAEELFRTGGSLRESLQQGEMREALRTTLRVPGTPERHVFCTVAPLSRESRRNFDPRVAYVILIRSAEDLLGRRCSEMSAEAETIKLALEQHQWQREATARSLGMSRTTLWRKMREAGLVRNSG